jgi:hypothetical protein
LRNRCVFFFGTGPAVGSGDGGACEEGGAGLDKGAAGGGVRGTCFGVVGSRSIFLPMPGASGSGSTGDGAFGAAGLVPPGITGGLAAFLTTSGDGRPFLRSA